jgi:hypothetical protein
MYRKNVPQNEMNYNVCVLLRECNKNNKNVKNSFSVVFLQLAEKFCLF